MNRQDYRELLQLIQHRLRESGRGEWDMRIRQGLRMETGDPAELVLIYLRRLHQIVLAQSDRVADVTLGMLRRYVRTEEGGPIEDVRLVMSPSDRELYGVQEVVLRSEPSYTEFAESLSALIHDIQYNSEEDDDTSWEQES